MERSQDLAFGGPEMSQWLGPFQVQLATGWLAMYFVMALLTVVFVAGMTAGCCLASVCRVQHRQFPGACSLGNEQDVAPTHPVIARPSPPDLAPARERRHHKQTQSQTTFLHYHAHGRFKPLTEREQGCWLEPGEY